MTSKKKLLLRIKQIVAESEPTATVILYGSHARGEGKKHSDFDLLILVDSDKLTNGDEKRIKNPLYDLEFETGKIISPLVLSRKDWETKHAITPFYQNVQQEGVLL